MGRKAPKIKKEYGFISSSSVTTTSIQYTTTNTTEYDQNTPTTHVFVAIESLGEETSTPIPVLLPTSTSAAIKIQSAYRSHLVRSLVKKIRAVQSEADRFEGLIRQQETVDAVRKDERERLRMNEGLMSLLLRLDSVIGIYPPVRELRRATSRRIVALQDLLDAVAEARVADSYGFPPSWEEFVAGMGMEGDDVEGGRRRNRRRDDVCDGFECLQRFLSI